MGRPEALPELIARSTDRSRQSAALRQGAQSLSYGELQARAVQLAAELACAGVGAGHVVALDLPRGPRMIAGMLAAGILGAAFLPLDADEPAGHRTRAVQNAAAAAVVTDDEVHAAPAALCLDGRPAYATRRAHAAATFRATVTTQHEAVDRIENAVAEYRLRPGDRRLHLASPASESGIEEIFSTLTAGATLVLPDAECVYDDVADFLRLLDERGITVLGLPTDLCDTFATQLRHSPRVLLPRALRLVVAGATDVTPETGAAWQAAARNATFRIIRSVGPTAAGHRRPVALSR